MSYCQRCGEGHLTSKCPHVPKNGVTIEQIVEISKPVNKNVQRVYRWRERHPEEYRKYQRELMRKRRANGG